MFLELAELLDCPRCRDGAGLVTFVARADRRRVLDGHLGCPLCEVEFQIARGAIRFAAGPGVAGGEPDGLQEPPADAAVRAAALLGLGERGAAVLLDPALAPLAPEIARLGGRVEILAWLGADPPETWDATALARGVNPLLGVDPDRWPVRARGLHGAALFAPSRGRIGEAFRALRSDGRLVVFEAHRAAREALGALEVETLAEDERTWVGRRP